MELKNDYLWRSQLADIEASLKLPSILIYTLYISILYIIYMCVFIYV